MLDKIMKENIHFINRDALEKEFLKQERIINTLSNINNNLYKLYSDCSRDLHTAEEQLQIVRHLLHGKNEELIK